MTDKVLRDLTAKNPDNGCYAYSICRKCHSFKANIDGNPKTAKITKQCDLCFGDDELDSTNGTDVVL